MSDNPDFRMGAYAVGQLVKQRFDSGLVVWVSGIILLDRQEDHVAPDDLFLERDTCGFALPTEGVTLNGRPHDGQQVVSLEPPSDKGPYDRIGRCRIVAPEQDVVTWHWCLNE